MPPPDAAQVAAEVGRALAEDIGASKPHPDMFQAALEQSGVAARQIVHVGDNPEHDIRGAQEMGMYTVWMNSQGEEWPGGPRADGEIDNLRQLPAAITTIIATENAGAE